MLDDVNVKVYTEKMKGAIWHLQCKFDLADTDLAENLNLKDTLQKIWATIFDF